VVYRRKSAAGAIAPLERLDLPRAKALRWLWNPGTRRYKVVFDLAEGVHPRRHPDRASDEVPDALVLSEPYLALLSLVSGRAGAAGPGLVQFGIVHRRWPDDEKLVFLSRWHALPG